MKRAARNFNCRYGEIDLILRDREQLVFAEVRYRGDASRGGGAASVGGSEASETGAAARDYLQAHPLASRLPAASTWSVAPRPRASPQFEWMRSAFEAFEYSG